MEAQGEQPPKQQPSPASEEEVRERIEEELKRVRVEDLMLQTVSGLLNLTVRRIAKDDERDLAQAQKGIEAVRAWVDLLPDDAAKQVREALSELQMLYAKQAEAGQAGEAGTDEEGGDQPAQGPPPPPPPPPQGETPKQGQEPPPRLWTPPGSK
jgi:hypothetical protein